jgi:hypothetical protein
MDQYLFSYGTLQTESVQLATFGRKLNGVPDALAGYRLNMIQIDDQNFVTTSGADYHRNLEFTGAPSDRVEEPFSPSLKENSNKLMLTSLMVTDAFASNCSQRSTWVYLSQ